MIERLRFKIDAQADGHGLPKTTGYNLPAISETVFAFPVVAVIDLRKLDVRKWQIRVMKGATENDQQATLRRPAHNLNNSIATSQLSIKNALKWLC